YESALEVYTQQAFPSGWASTQNNLGNTYLYRITGEKADNLETAIACFQCALKVRTQQAFPTDWAMTQYNLGNAYSNRIRGEKADNLETAIACFQCALEVRTQQAFPSDWASTQNNLGLAYSDRIRGEKADNLETAIACFQCALEVRTQQAFPSGWASTQNNLGAAYSDRITGEKADNLETAIACFQSALEVYTQQAFPYNWAMTQNNLGAAYSNRITGEKADNLETAIACYQSALEVYTQQAFPTAWAMTQNNLGAAYSDRITGEKADNLETAIACFQSALEVCTQQAFPTDWAMTQNNLGAAYSDRITGEKADNLETAIACFQSALEVCTQQAFPTDWAMTQNNLGAAYSDRITGEKADNLETAIACFQSALEVRTQQAFPYDWATTQHNLGIAYSDRIRGEKADNLETAINCYQCALEVRTQQAFPADWATTQHNLGITYRNRIRGEKEQNLETAIACFQSAIETVEYLRDEIISGSGIEEYKTKLAEQWNRLYLGIVEVCLELEDYTQALEYLERSKNRNLIELILIREFAQLFPSEVVNQLRELQIEIASNQKLLQTGTADNPTNLAQHLKELRQQRNSLQDKHLAIGSRFKFEQFQATLEENTAIVEFYIGRSRFFTFIFTRHSQQPLVLSSSSDDLDELIDWTNAYLKDYYQQPQDWSNQLSSRLQKLAEILNLKEILQELPKDCNQLILIPHQYLHLFPLHALPLPENPGKCLLDKYSQGVRYAPSCQLLQLVQNRQRPDFTHLFAIQNPTRDLKYTDMEVEIIQSYFDSAKILPQTEATKSAIDNTNLKDSHCAHFSCHGLFDFQNPRQSALILAGSETAATKDSQLVTLRDGTNYNLENCLSLNAVLELDLENCRLVTLSACETGLVDLRSTSDEYIGLPSGFLVAGSTSVVASLWKVNDLTTALLMIKFYQNLQQHLPVALALNQAQTWLRDVTKQKLVEWMSNLPLRRETKQELKNTWNWYKPQTKLYNKPEYWAAFCAIGQ
ncbi:MAG: CHAT domain-containing protein, partial [Symploca sp. SIO2E9]|nr:CHAT domain-containing protein [Symploca sp. SIO2E9]